MRHLGERSERNSLPFVNIRVRVRIRRFVFLFMRRVRCQKIVARFLSSVANAPPRPPERHHRHAPLQLRDLSLETAQAVFHGDARYVHHARSVCLFVVARAVLVRRHDANTGVSRARTPAPRRATPRRPALARDVPPKAPRRAVPPRTHPARARTAVPAFVCARTQLGDERRGARRAQRRRRRPLSSRRPSTPRAGECASS